MLTEYLQDARQCATQRTKSGDPTCPYPVGLTVQQELNPVTREI